MTTYTIDPIRNKLVADKESKDVKMMKKLKKEKTFENILDKKVKPLNVEEAIALQNRNYDTWGLLKATAQTPKEKAELRAKATGLHVEKQLIATKSVNNLENLTEEQLEDKMKEINKLYGGIIKDEAE